MFIIVCYSRTLKKVTWCGLDHNESIYVNRIMNFKEKLTYC